jgi:hypothetical protein
MTRKETRVTRRSIARLVGTLTLITTCALAFDACGTPATPHYQGGGNGGASTTSTSPSQGGPSSAATKVASQFVALNWSSDPTWPDANYVYALERPYVTPAMNAANAAQAARPVPATELDRWQQDVRFKAGTYAEVAASWVVADAGVTPTTCVVEVDFLLGTTTAGVRNPVVGPVNTYAFQMRRIGSTWYVASPPQQPE